MEIKDRKDEIKDIKLIGKILDIEDEKTKHLMELINSIIECPKGHSFREETLYEGIGYYICPICSIGYSYSSWKIKMN